MQRRSHRARAGFTIIELLVVMSVIGLMASIILAGLMSARDRARVGSAISFSSSMYQSYGADALGYWKFDEPSNANAIDYGPNGYTLVSAGTNVLRSSNTPVSSGNALDFTGVSSADISDYLSADVSSKNLNISAQGYTASFWAYLPTVTTPGTIFDLVNWPTNCGDLAYALIPTGATQITVGPLITGAPSISYSFPISKWFQVTFSYNGASTETRLYVDGKYVNHVTGIVSFSGDDFVARKLFVGVRAHTNCTSPDAPATHFNGLIDELAIYPTVYTAAQIHDLYALELPRHLLATRP